MKANKVRSHSRLRRSPSVTTSTFRWTCMSFGKMSGTRLNRLLVGLGIAALVLLLGGGLWVYGQWERLDVTEKRSECRYVCTICGLEKKEYAVAGLVYQSEQRQTDLSNWYRDTGQRCHSHKWEKQWWFISYWDGTAGCNHSSFLETLPLQLLHDVSAEVDLATAQALRHEYEAAQEDEAVLRSFIERCWKILAAVKSRNIEGESRVHLR